jgi:hypothetical protein
VHGIQVSVLHGNSNGVVAPSITSDSRLPTPPPETAAALVSQGQAPIHDAAVQAAPTPVLTSSAAGPPPSGLLPSVPPEVTGGPSSVMPVSVSGITPKEQIQSLVSAEGAAPALNGSSHPLVRATAENVPQTIPDEQSLKLNQHTEVKTQATVPGGAHPCCWNCLECSSVREQGVTTHAVSWWTLCE